MKKLIERQNNVFEDLGFDSSESMSLKIRCELMMAIKKYIHQKQLTQADAAKIMGVD